MSCVFLHPVDSFQTAQVQQVSKLGSQHHVRAAPTRHCVRPEPPRPLILVKSYNIS